MTHIELPRALEDYFAFAETDPTRAGRRFSISLPYFDGSRLDRLQWWYHLSREQEQRLGDTIVKNLRQQATERFRKHIERWLENTGQRLVGDEPIPHIARLEATAVTVPAAPVIATAGAGMDSTDAVTPAPDESSATVLPWPAEKVANG
jgi:hypothetical protein